MVTDRRDVIRHHGGTGVGPHDGGIATIDDRIPCLVSDGRIVAADRRREASLITNQRVVATGCERLPGLVAQDAEPGAGGGQARLIADGRYGIDQHPPARTVAHDGAAGGRRHRIARLVSDHCVVGPRGEHPGLVADRRDWVRQHGTRRAGSHARAARIRGHHIPGLVPDQGVVAASHQLPGLVAKDRVRRPRRHGGARPVPDDAVPRSRGEQTRIVANRRDRIGDHGARGIGSDARAPAVCDHGVPAEAPDQGRVAASQ